MANQTAPVKVLIMCGGKGTRMWPISNVGHPKQFEGLLGKTSMFRQTVERALKGFKPQDIYIATSKSFVEYLRDQASEIPEQNWVLEPAMRDNLGAIALATSVIHHRDPDSTIIYLWGADHLVKDAVTFLKAIKTAAQIAHEKKRIVFVDAKPTYPSVHNGWMKLGALVKQENSFQIYELIRQVEKPNEETARRFFRSKQYAIHTGYMASEASVMLDYYRTYAPDTYAVIREIQLAIDSPHYQSVLEREYQKFEKVAVDYGLLEKLPAKSQLDMVAEFGWVDVGTWELLYEGLQKDDNGNVVIGKAHLMDTKNSLVICKDVGTVGLIGLDEMVVVDTESGLLVCPLSEAPKVKQLYKALFE